MIMIPVKTILLIVLLLATAILLARADDEVCKDKVKGKKCENILKNGECSKPFASKKCAKTCGFCEGNTYLY